jgi:hypothetical protein
LQIVRESMAPESVPVLETQGLIGK